MGDPTPLLGEIETSIKKLKDECYANKVDIKGVDLKALFVALRECSNQENLPLVAEVFKTGCDVLVEKFRRIQAFVELLEDPDKILAFFSTSFDFESSPQVLGKCLLKPCDFPGLSSQYLLDSLHRLNSPKRPPIELISPEAPPPGSLDVFLLAHRFEALKEEVFAEVKASGSTSITTILKNHLDPEVYYEAFMAILHLIQDGRLRYHEDTQNLDLMLYE